MRPQPTVSIPQPCHENWQHMMPASGGRHCAACQKVVIDFTHKTDAEILAYLQQPRGNTCGRFAATQLERPLLPATPTTPRWRTWLAAAVAVWGLREAAAEATQAQQAPLELRPTIPPTKAEILAARRRVPVDTVRGRVVDAATHEGVPGAEILLSGTTIAALTDSTGHFTLVRSLEAAPQVIMIVSPGYYPSQFPVSVTSAVDIALTPINNRLETYVLGATVAPVTIIQNPAPTFWDDLRRLFGY